MGSKVSLPLDGSNATESSVEPPRFGSSEIDRLAKLFTATESSSPPLAEVAQIVTPVKPRPKQRAIFLL